MARSKVMKLWNAVVTAFLALCTALGLITTTAAAAVPQTQKTRNSDSAPTTEAPASAALLWSRSLIRALPPTMKQRIHAEAHGKSPGCRHRPHSDTATEQDTAAEQDRATEQDTTAEQDRATGQNTTAEQGRASERPDPALVPAHCAEHTASTLPAPASARIPLQR
ncbi:DUF6344 domain-containing protein [Streptomyces sp. NPDC096105]|uniref:DUF6344 domain-containing protein n=1 Tax=Streptomyces sp. NPDC096105 TaxID=3366074 RepID=UPI00381EBBE4